MLVEYNVYKLIGAHFSAIFCSFITVESGRLVFIVILVLLFHPLLPQCSDAPVKLTGH